MRPGSRSICVLATDGLALHAAGPVFVVARRATDPNGPYQLQGVVDHLAGAGALDRLTSSEMRCGPSPEPLGDGARSAFVVTTVRLFRPLALTQPARAGLSQMGPDH